MILKFLRGLITKSRKAETERAEIEEEVPSKVTSLRERFPQYQIGEHSYGELHVHAWGDGTTLTIANYCSFAKGVQIILGGEHRPDWVTTFPFNVLWHEAQHISGHPASKGNVVIGNDVWIGTEALILSGVRIGDGAVIGARAVVAKDVPPYAIVAGNPARVLRKRFNEDLIERLLHAKWWEWDHARIVRGLPLLLSKDIEGFLQAVEQGKL